MNIPFFRLFFLFSFLFGQIQLSAQNLIPDSGFEIWDGTVGSPPNTMSPLDFWYNANGTPDHHHQQNPPGSNLTSLVPCPIGNGNTECGYPYEGMGVLGCWKGNGADGTREWAGVEMTEPMVPGGCYRVSFWIQNKEDHPDFFMASNQWGIYFSQTEFPFFSPNVANYSAMEDHFVMTEAVIDTGDWRFFEYDYVASEDFKYAYVGYMGDGSTATTFTWSNSFSIGFYVWFDDIRVERIETQLELTDDAVICLGDSLLINAESNFPIIWTDGTMTDSTTSFWVKPDQTQTWYFQTLDSTECSIFDSVVVTVVGSESVDIQADITKGCPPLEINFSDISSVHGIEYDWDFGDGNLSDNVIATSHIYEESGVYDLTLTVKYFEDCFTSTTFEGIEIFDLPTADFEFSAGQNSNGQPEVQFTDLSVGNLAAWAWDFGDGTDSGSQNPDHTYKLPGTYEVVLFILTVRPSG